jgi:hypothetical protein
MSAMDLSKIEVIIDKINFIFQDIKLTDQPEKNDIKLLQKYVDELAGLVSTSGQVIKQKTENPPIREKITKTVKQDDPNKKPAHNIINSDIEAEIPKKPGRIEPIQKEGIENPVVGKGLISFANNEEEVTIGKEEKKAVEKPKEHKPVSKKQPEVPNHQDDEIPSINEKFKNVRTDISEKLKEKRIQSLVKEIDLNDKFWFINELFEGNSALFNQILNELDTLRTYDDARDAIQNQIKGKYDWKENERASDKFMRLVKRRYA